MNATEQHVALAAQMYECRAAARRLLGEKFRERMEERARIVRAVAKREMFEANRALEDALSA